MMENAELRRRIESVKARCRDHWTDILVRLGVREEILNGRNQPCPMCGGRDRFRYTDKFREGNYICSKCGAGDGFKLAEGVLKLTFWDVFTRVEEIVGSGAQLRAGARQEPSLQFKMKVVREAWEQSRVITEGDEVDRYLRGRCLGMKEYPSALRCHPALGYYMKRPGDKKATLVGQFPAMVAPLQGEDGGMLTLHRTYVQEGRKAPVTDPKKVMHSFAGGPAVRLYEPTDELAIAEGIETALAVRLSTGKPVWAVYSASNMEKLFVPPQVRKVCIYADNDRSFTGQAAAFALAKRLKCEVAADARREVAVFVPKIADTDWADVWASSFRRQKAA